MDIPHVFISHSHEEDEIALAWKALIEQTSMGRISVWLSSDTSPEGGMPAGEQWSDVIYERLQEATHVLAILSPQSLSRHWIWWECGVARGLKRERKLIPIVHFMKVDDLPQPMSAYQAFAGDDRESVRQLCVRLIAETDLKPSPQHWGSMLDEFERSVNPPRQSEGGVLIDHSHGQKKWNWDGATAPSVLELPHVQTIVQHPGTRQVKVEAIGPAKQITSRMLRSSSGLVFAMPLEAHLARGTRDVIVDWVQRGGRLLLLGYQLGDRHHNGNLNELAYAFGLHFEGDIVAPPSWEGADKPYGRTVTFSFTPEAHPVLSGLEDVSLVNVQTIRGEPGTARIVGLGDNLVGRISNPPADVRYRNGAWRIVSQKMEFVPADSTHAVLVEAPHGLTGEGRVLALGSWKFAAGENGDKLLRNLLLWLAGHA